MARRQYPSELNTKTVRVSIGDWHLLMGLAHQQDTTVAEALHLALTNPGAINEQIKKGEDDD